MPKCQHPNARLQFVVEYWLDGQSSAAGPQITRDAIASVKVDATCPDCGFASRFNAYSATFQAVHGYGAAAWSHWPAWLRRQASQVAALSPFVTTALRVCGLDAAGEAA